MKKVSIKTTLIALAMFTSMLASCGETTSSNSDKETVTTPVTVKSSTTEVSSPTETNEDSSSVADSSEYETTTTKTSLDDSSDSEKAETTTKAVTDNSDKETKETTSAKQTTAQPKATTTAKAVVATTAVRATQSTAKPVVTTKTTTKATAKQTTKAMTKATTKATADPTAKLSPYYKALYRIGNGIASASDYETVRNELHKYGQSIAPTYTLDKSLTLYVTKNGKHTNYNETGASYDEVTCLEPYQITNYGTKVSDLNYIDKQLKRIIKMTLNYYDWKNANKYYKPTWYIQFGDISHNKKTEWLLCIANVE